MSPEHKDTEGRRDRFLAIEHCTVVVILDQNSVFVVFVACFIDCRTVDLDY